MRSLTLPHLPDGFKLELEMGLYDLLLYLLRRNGKRLAGLLVRRTHDWPGLLLEEADACLCAKASLNQGLQVPHQT